MNYVTVNETQRAFLFKHGKFLGLLPPGRHLMYGGRTAELVGLDQPVHSAFCGLEVLLQCPEVAQAAAVVEVPDQKLALHFVNDKFASTLPKGRYAYWSIYEKHDFQLVDISRPEADESVPAYIFKSIPSSYYTRIDVASYQRGLLCLNNRFERLLEPGTYYFWRNTPVKAEIDLVDTRLTQMDVTGQEILTQDKVSLRINFVCNYRITDYVRIFTEIDDFKEQLHVAAQLALRDYVGKHKLDEILETKEEISQYVLQRLKEQEKSLFVEISGGGVKDIILPGEIREIINTVLVAEKRAQASVITRREEVASTRSLLNTARLMDENQTLMRLKELEYIERICANVGSINLNGSGDLLAQLTAILRG